MKTAIIAGSGQLPLTLAKHLDTPVYVTFDGTQAPDGTHALPARLEQLGALFTALKSADVARVVFAGAMARPKIDPSLLDQHAMRLAACFPKGDDALLREVLALFSEQGFELASGAEIAPELVLAAGTNWGSEPSRQDLADAEKATTILTTLSPLDLGQGAVVAGGHALGIETLQGTDAMLTFVAQTPAHLRRAKGVFVKLPKEGQDLRIDMPVVGPDTAAAAAKAGVAGIVIRAGEVIVLQQDAVRRALDEAGLFLLAQ